MTKKQIKESIKTEKTDREIITDGLKYGVDSDIAIGYRILREASFSENDLEYFLEKPWKYKNDILDVIDIESKEDLSGEDVEDDQA